MRKSSRRLFDAGLMILGLLLAVAVLNICLLCGATLLALAMTVITWLMCSLPVAVLIGHCALGEVCRTGPRSLPTCLVGPPA
jgi:hypothetical protein